MPLNMVFFWGLKIGLDQNPITKARLPPSREINSDNTLLCTDMGLSKEIIPKQFSPCNSLNHKRVRVMYFREINSETYYTCLCNWNLSEINSQKFKVMKILKLGSEKCGGFWWQIFSRFFPGKVGIILSLSTSPHFIARNKICHVDFALGASSPKKICAPLK